MSGRGGRGDSLLRGKRREVEVLRLMLLYVLEDYLAG